MRTCPYFPQCTGCTSWHKSYEEQQDFKIRTLQGLLQAQGLRFAADIGFVSCGERELRHRMDFTLRYDDAASRHRFGFYDREKNLLDIERCLQISPELQDIYREFREFDFSASGQPLRKGSVRLRTGTDGRKGCWLDFANTDVKALLDDGKLLSSLLRAGYSVEIGQKGKRLTDTSAGLKLTDPVAENWFETCGPNGENLALFGLISDFTQPSRATAKSMVRLVLEWLTALPAGARLLEFGPGLGQFTLGFLQAGYHVTAVEIHARAAAQLEANAAQTGFSHRLQVYTGDYHREPVPEDLTFDAAFVNPARSGLRDFTAQILKAAPEHLVYVSCFPESMCEDLRTLSARYEIHDLKIVDQFPQTGHFETLALLKKSGQ